MLVSSAPRLKNSFFVVIISRHILVMVYMHFFVRDGIGCILLSFSFCSIWNSKVDLFLKIRVSHNFVLGGNAKIWLHAITILECVVNLMH